MPIEFKAIEKDQSGVNGGEQRVVCETLRTRIVGALPLNPLKGT